MFFQVKTIEDHSAIALTMFDPIENIVIVGIAIKIDKDLNQIKMNGPDAYKLII